MNGKSHNPNFVKLNIYFYLFFIYFYFLLCVNTTTKSVSQNKIQIFGSSASPIGQDSAHALLIRHHIFAPI